MRVAIIDLGTNSVRFDIYKIIKANTFDLLHREKLMIRLGQGVFLSQKLDPHASRRTIQALVNFRRLMNEYCVQETYAFATSALRTAKDSDFFVKRVKKRTGIDVQIISGKEEARLIAKGILAYEKNIRGKVALVDIGGGSTEINICQGSKILFSHSFDLGVARLQEVFLKSTPPIRHPDPKLDPVEMLKTYCRNLIEAELKPHILKNIRELIGSSGTIKALQAILLNKISKTSLNKLSQKMVGMNSKELLTLPRIEAKRTDLILAGTLLFEVICDILKPKSVRSTEFALREGIILDKLSSLAKITKTTPHQDLSPFIKKAEQLCSDKAHFLKVLEFSRTIYHFLEERNLIKKNILFPLECAAVMHDVGFAISPSQHNLHSAYIIENSQLPFSTEQEMHYVSALCRFHRNNKNPIKNLTSIHKKEKNDFLKILSILRLADAMDYGHKSAFSYLELKLTAPRTLELTVKQTGSSYLEEIKIEQKKILFEDLFQLKILLNIKK